MILPYVSVLVGMALLITPYLEKEKHTLMDTRKHRYVISSNEFLVFCAYIIYIIFAVFKSVDLGKSANDAYAYYINFMRADCSFVSFMTNITVFEPGYSFVVWIIRSITSNYKWALWFWHTLTFVSTISFYKRAYLKNNSIFITFVGLFLLISQFNTLRMSISISIAMNSFWAMYQKRWIKAMAIILLASSMHMSAVIMFPVLIVEFIIFNKNKYKKSILIALIFAGMVMAIGVLGVVNSIMMRTLKAVYVGHSSIAYGTDLAIIVFSILSFVRFRKMKKLIGLNEVFMIALPIGVVCIPLQFSLSIMYRMLLYFLPIILVLIPSIITCYAQEKQLLNRILPILVSYVYLIIRIYSFCTEELQYVREYVFDMVR